MLLIYSLIAVKQSITSEKSYSPTNIFLTNQTTTQNRSQQSFISLYCIQLVQKHQIYDKNSYFGWATKCKGFFSLPFYCFACKGNIYKVSLWFQRFKIHLGMFLQHDCVKWSVVCSHFILTLKQKIMWIGSIKEIHENKPTFEWEGWVKKTHSPRTRAVLSLVTWQQMLLFRLEQGEHCCHRCLEVLCFFVVETSFSLSFCILDRKPT